MSDTAAAGGALQSYVDKWLLIQPYQRVALAFVDPRRYPGHIALAALEQELLAAAYGIREPQVATTKLHWWAEELAGAAGSGGRHPLTQRLFADDRARALPTTRWLAPVLAATAQLEEGTAADFSAQLLAAAPLHDAFAALETAWWFGPDASCERAARCAALGHLLHALRRLQDDAGRDRLPLSMACLARYGLSRRELDRPGVARTQAIKAQLADLHADWGEAVRLPGLLSVFRALESRHDVALVERARRSPDPLAVLQNDSPRSGIGDTFAAWQAARAWRRNTD